MSSDKPASQLRLRVFGGPNGIGVRKNYIIAKTPLKNRWSTPKPSVAIATMCVRLHNDGPAHGRGGLVTFVLAKVTKTVSAEMLLSAAGLCPQTGENLGLQLFRRATLSLQYPVCENLLCPAPYTTLPVFPGFFPKLFCGRSTANIFQETFGSSRFLNAQLT